MNQSTGHTLIEAMVAVVIMGIVITGLTGMLLHTRSIETGSTYKARALRELDAICDHPLLSARYYTDTLMNAGTHRPGWKVVLDNRGTAGTSDDFMAEVSYIVNDEKYAVRPAGGVSATVSAKRIVVSCEWKENSDLVDVSLEKLVIYSYAR